MIVFDPLLFRHTLPFHKQCESSSMTFPPEFLDEVRARLPVSEVVGKRVKLQKVGREWKGLSPFSEEKTPSLFVNDQKKMWFDFSSGKNGDVFDFVIETEGVSFSEAVERLATLAGMQIPAISDAQHAPQYIKRLDLRAWLHDQPFEISIAYAA